MCVLRIEIDRDKNDNSNVGCLFAFCVDFGVPVVVVVVVVDVLSILVDFHSGVDFRDEKVGWEESNGACDYP